MTMLSAVPLILISEEQEGHKIWEISTAGPGQAADQSKHLMNCKSCRLSSSCVGPDLFVVSLGEKVSPPLLRWLCGTSKTLQKNICLIHSMRPGLPVPPPPTSPSTASCALAAARWLFQEEGEQGGKTPCLSQSHDIFMWYTLDTHITVVYQSLQSLFCISKQWMNEWMNEFKTPGYERNRKTHTGKTWLSLTE